MTAQEMIAGCKAMCQLQGWTPEGNVHDSSDVLLFSAVVEFAQSNRTIADLNERQIKLIASLALKEPS